VKGVQKNGFLQRILVVFTKRPKEESMAPQLKDSTTFRSPLRTDARQHIWREFYQTQSEISAKAIVEKKGKKT